MIQTGNIPLVTTVRERCRVCFTCVRECPAKAIRILDGQAEVVPERCIGCGNCVRVCSQNAKQVRDCTANARGLLKGDKPVAACVAPSFPAAFGECDYREFVGMLRALGFTYVHEVAFGADLVARQYHKLFEGNSGRHYIATTCPAVIAFVERYHPELVPALAPVVSPMVATARVVKELYGSDVRVVFIGPCIAKKGEMLSDALPRDVHATLAFTELQRMLYEACISPEKVIPGDFDPPHAGPGTLFPIRGGLLQAADLREDLMTGEIVTADGRVAFVEAIREFQAPGLGVALLEVLACQGCISGPGIDNDVPLFRRRGRVSRYARQHAEELDLEQWNRDMARFEALDLSRGFNADDQRVHTPSEEDIARTLARMNKRGPADMLNCGACGYETCREHAIAICRGLAEVEMCLPYTIEGLKTAVRELALSHEQLAKMHQALMQSERLASVGQLAAGIAHEINNPLGVVLMYTHMLRREAAGNGKLGEDLNTIAEQADRCKKIVAGLLHFARQNKLTRQAADVREVVKSGFGTCPPPAGIEVGVVDQMTDPIAEIDRDQVVQVLANLFSNAYGAMGDAGRLSVELSDTDSHVVVTVGDTGSGIPEEVRDKIFEPFFTTKQIGKGTGLGLAITYGIVKMHCGDIRVTSNTDPGQGPTGTAFTVTLPRH